MSKVRRRRQETGRRNPQNTSSVQNRNTQLSTTTATRTASLNRPFISPGVRDPQSLIFPVMVALGCWGIAFSFIFLTTEANHVLFGAMAVLMALLWSFSVGIRIRKLLLLRQRT